MMEEGNNDVVVSVWRMDRERLAPMRREMSKEPRLLRRKAGHSSCCIFTVPRRLVDINDGAYQPNIISIGPYHRGEPQLRMMEEHKWRYLGSLIARIRTESRELRLENLLTALHPQEMRARECYSKTIDLDTHNFLEMLVLDGCFIIEFFRKMEITHLFQPDDPLKPDSWLFSFFLRDLILLENQLPFFVLQLLFDLTKMPEEESSLASLVLRIFNNTLRRSDEILKKHCDLTGNHMLDLLRLSFMPQEGEVENQPTDTCFIQCVSKLRKAGIKLKKGEADSFLTIKFRNGVIEMPRVTMSDFLTCFLQNCVAFEQCHQDCSKHITMHLRRLAGLPCQHV